MNSLERPAFGSADISQTRLTRRRFFQLAAVTTGATVAAGPFLIPHIAEQALRQITPVPGEKVDFREYFARFHRLREDNPLYAEAFKPITYEPYPFSQTRPDHQHPFGTLQFHTDQSTSLDLVLPSRPTDNVSLHPLLVRVDDQKEAYFYPLIQSVRPTRQHMRLVVDQGDHEVVISPLSDSPDQSVLGKPELGILHGTPLQEALQNILPVFNVRPDLLNHPTKDALLFAFTTLHINHAGILGIQQHVIASSEESNQSVQSRYDEFDHRTIDIETIEMRKTRYDSRTGQIDKEMLLETAILQVRGHEWRKRYSRSSIDQITETDNVGGPAQLTHRGLSSSLNLLPPGWKNIDLVAANPEMQILGFREEIHKHDWFFRGLPKASEMADDLLRKLRHNPQGVYPSIS